MISAILIMLAIGVLVAIWLRYISWTWGFLLIPIFAFYFFIDNNKILEIHRYEIISIEQSVAEIGGGKGGTTPRGVYNYTYLDKDNNYLTDSIVIGNPIKIIPQEGSPYLLTVRENFKYDFGLHGVTAYEFYLPKKQIDKLFKK